MQNNPLTDLQKQRNESSVSSWDIAQPHRQQVTSHLLQNYNPANPRLCILGAGNCNDIDLATLAGTYESIDLVDIDRSAVEKGVTNQRLEESASLTIHGELDVTGVWEQLGSLNEAADKSDAAIDELIKNSNEWAGLEIPGEYGTVASTCLLSQLIDGVHKGVGVEHERNLELVGAIRQRHFQLLYDLVCPGGTAIMITDFVSSETAPDLPILSGRALTSRLGQMINDRNFFTGLNPMRLTALLHEPEFLSGPVTDQVCASPWLWNLGPRHYAVTALRFRKAM